MMKLPNFSAGSDVKHNVHRPPQKKKTPEAPVKTGISGVCE